MIWRSLTRRRLVGVMVVVFVVAIVGVVGYQLYRQHLSESILAKLDRLVLQTPEGMTELQWAVYVYWTHNLHCEAIPQLYASISSLRELDQILDDANVNGPGPQTIERLWDEYERISESGFRYRQQYEPVRDEIVDAVVKEGANYFDADSYRGLLKSQQPTPSQE
jgi:hypothetical protein